MQDTCGVKARFVLVQSLGLRVHDVGFRVQGLGFRAYRVQDLGFMVAC